MWPSDKLHALQRAREHLDSGDDERLSYACLELRFALEDVVYRKLKLYASRVPPEMIEAWQPPQAMRALKELEPLADENTSWRIAKESSLGVADGPWQHVGDHVTIKIGRLRKLYNLLGSYLHVPSPKVRSTPSEQRTQKLARIRQTLQEVLKEVTPVIECDFDAAVAQIIYFPCKKCGKEVVRNEESARKTGRARCLDPACGAEHRIFDVEGELAADLIATHFVCQACGQPIEIETRLLEIEYRFPCAACGVRHYIAGRQWQYGRDEA